jgi:uncharacterized integral membrane protein
LNLIRVMPAKGQDMQKSQQIARLIGPVLCTIGIAMLINPEAYRHIAEEFLATPAFIYVTGVLLLAAGLAILNAHPLWTADWRSLVTLAGWIGTIAGVWRILAPNFVPFVGAAIIAHQNFFIGLGGVLVALGGFLSFKGYVSAADAAEMETQQ